MELLPEDNLKSNLLLLLLLLHLFVGSFAADCPKPEVGENMVLSEAALLKNDFPEGSKVLLECARGYEKASGSGTIDCVDNKWTEPDLNCKKMDCGQPKPEPHMSFNTSGGTVFGSRIKVICEEGYWILGTSFKHCYATGWFGKATCQIFTCPKPAEVKNGKNSWIADTEPEYGQVINFTCNEGYVLSGSKNITCGKTKYDSPPPQCIGATTEDNIKTSIITSATATTQQERTTASPSATTVVARIFTSISTPQQGDKFITFEKKAPRTSEPSSTTTSLKDQTVETLNIHKDKGYAAVIISVVVVTTVVCIVAFFLNKFLMKRKG
ncbi:complement decay-accelerating factor, GPI-anchored [Fundulus heteroclitus]|uniref:complement decay-accelerating factor, GPI-anchored n=1 Tax=Fundulus heteroclitus TaxID=8078 RepID=UPI00165BC50A|nr:complement decay-accelerating factor, GPI-anchored [Fundulus heteroclitus]